MVSENWARHKKLTHVIANEITRAANQRISFARFMELALLAPSLGYYQSSAKVLGRQGDFVTAPEISSLWSGCIARYCRPILNALPSRHSVIMEIGAGTGRMAADVMLVLERMGCLPHHYIIVEVSDALRRQQKANLKQWVPHLVARVEHLKEFPSEPIEGVILANEILDVLPVHRFLVSEGALYEHYVGWEGGQFVWQKGRVSDALKAPLEAIHSEYLEGVESYSSEVSVALDSWLRGLQTCLKRGYILLSDYGRSASEYYHPARMRGTLRCYYQQRCYDNPLARVGLQDITCDVDFTRVAQLAVEVGLSVHAFVSQAAFLVSSGLLAHDELCYDKDLYLELKGQIHQLMSPQEMGELCKVMVLGRDLPCDLLSLEEYDKRFSL